MSFIKAKLSFISLVLLLSTFASASTITWTGGGDGISWGDPHNWGGNVLPGTADDVIIGAVAGNPVIQISNATGSVKIKSLNCSEPLSISGGSVTVGAASSSSTISSTFTATGGSITFTGAGSSFIASGPASLQAVDIETKGGAIATFPTVTDISGLTFIKVSGSNSKLSFPSVTSYTQPASTVVAWIAGDRYSNNVGCQLNFPALQTIVGTVAAAYYTNADLEINAIQGAELNLPVLASVTVPAGSVDRYSNGGVRFNSSYAGVINAGALTTFADNSTPAESSLTATDSGKLVFPKLTAPVGIQLNLNAISNPQQFTSLVKTRSLEINTGTVAMQLSDISGLTFIKVSGSDSKLSFPNVTSYTQPASTVVAWTAGDRYINNVGCQLNFPALQTIVGTVAAAYYTNADLEINAIQGAELNLPVLASITVPAGAVDRYSNGGVRFNSSYAGVINAGALTTFADNSTPAESSLTATDSGKLVFPKLTAPVGIQLNLNAISNPQQFTSLVKTRSLEINTGTVAMQLSDISGLTFIKVSGSDSKLSFPNVTSYTQPASTVVAWTAGDRYINNVGCQLNFPALQTIVGTVAAAYYTDADLEINAIQGAELNLPVLASVTVPAGSVDRYSNGGVRFTSSYAGVINAGALTTFADNSVPAESSLTATDSGIIAVPVLTNTIGVNVNLGTPFTISQGTNYAATGSLQGNVTNNGLLNVNASGQTLQIGGSLSGTGSIHIGNGATLSIAGSLTLNSPGLLTLPVSGTVALAGDFLGSSPGAGIDPSGTVLFKGAGPASALQHLEAMSRDLGMIPAGFSNNFVFGSLNLMNDTSVQLVDLSRNTSSATAECVYADSVVVPVGCTLDLNGLHLYARAAQIAGTVLNGSISQIPDSGSLVLGDPTPGKLVVAGELDEWTFYSRGGRNLSILVNPGAAGVPAPVTPQLQWVNVQLLDPSGNVLATGNNTVSGTAVTLSNKFLPVDGTYKIRIKAHTSHTASTGNYILGAYDVTPDVRELVLGQQTSGNIAKPFAVDQWTFTGVAGQQIRFDLIRSSSSAVSFKLEGSGGYIGFENITDDSSLINLPSSGNYTLSAYVPSAQTGSYSFTVQQTSITSLALDTAYAGTWVGSGQAQLFSINIAASSPLLLNLSDANGSHHSEIYANFGSAPTRQSYDYAANGSGSNHSLLVPSATAGTWYVLVYGENISNGSGTFSLLAKGNQVVLSGASTAKISPNTANTITLTGAGFNSGSVVTLVDSHGNSFPATSVSIDLLTQITATFAANTVPAGNYTIKVTQPGGASAQLGTALVVQAGQAELKTSVEVPAVLGRHGVATLYVNYANTGTAPMAAPLLTLTGTNPSGLQGAFLSLDASRLSAGFWTSAFPEGFSPSVQMLGSGATPGILAPGESYRIPIYYAGWLTSQWDFAHPSLNFNLRILRNDDATAMDWPGQEASLQPPGISTPAWHAIYAGLLPQLGTTSGSFVQLLDDQAAYLARIGQNVTDVGRLWSFAVAQASNLVPIRSLGASVDDSLPTPGKLSLSFDRTFNPSIPGRFQSGPFGFGWYTSWQQRLSISADGTVTRIMGNGARLTYQPDSRAAGRYFSGTGDYTKLALVSGSYQFTAVDGIVTAFTSAGLLDYQSDTNGNKITAGYSGGRLTSLVASAGQSLALAYNAAGRISTLTDSSGRITTYGYDAGNLRLLSVTAYSGLVTSYIYNTTSGVAAENALTTITQPGGTHQFLTYDTQGRIATISADGGARKQTLTYSAGQVNVTDALSNTFKFYFDQNLQLSKLVDGLGNATFMGHDANYNLTRITNALGASTSLSYNEIGIVTSATDFLGNTTHLVNGGPQNQLTALSDAKANNTLYKYSATGNLLKTTFANGRSENTTFDPLGNALSFTNAAGEAIQYGYNTAGQMTSASFPDGSSFTYTYDSRGHMKTATDSGGTITFTYHATTGFMTGVAYPGGKSLTFGYDAGGRRKSMVDQDGFTVNYAYDSAGRLFTLKDASNNLFVTYLYDANGRLSEKTNGNATYTTYDYDGNGQTLHLINYAPGGAINSRFDDTYNALGLKTGEVTLDGTWTYGYDACGQLTHAVFASKNTAVIPNQDLAYNYDAMGNRTSTVINGVTTNYVANNMNQYVSVGGTPYSYDAKGNLLSDGINYFTYNSLNKLIETKDGSHSTNYAHNSLGQRISTTSSGETRVELIDPFGLGDALATWNQSDNVVIRNIHGLQLVAQQSPEGVKYYDNDDLGSVTNVTGSSGGNLNKYCYLPFGDVLWKLENSPNSFQFLGGSGIENAGYNLLFMRARFFHVDSAQFVSHDPLGLWGGDFNLYRYAANDPISLSDPTGLRTWQESSEIANKNYANSWLERNVATVFGPVFPEYQDRLIDWKKIQGRGPNDNPLDDSIDFGDFLWRHWDSLWGPPPPPPQPKPSPSPNAGGGDAGGDGGSGTGEATDPNALYGPSGYGAANYVTSVGQNFAYRITFENDSKATAPAQRVTITNNLSPALDWNSFQLTGIGYADNHIVIPAGSQHFQTTLTMTYNNETFDVFMEAGIHSATGQVYAHFQSLDPGSDLPPANILTGFLPPEDGTGRGEGYLTYTVSPKNNLATGVVISNVASIIFDSNAAITTDQIDPHDASKGTDPGKQARVTIDAAFPSAQIDPLPAIVTPDFLVSWRSTGVSGGSGLASYTVYVSTDGGKTYKTWLANTTKTSAIYHGKSGTKYSFYVVARSHVGNLQQVDLKTAVVSTIAKTPVAVNGFDESLNFDDNLLPKGWAINAAKDDLAKTSVANKRFEARKTDTYGGLYRAKQLPATAGSFEISYLGNITGNAAGQSTQIQLHMGDGSRFETYIGKSAGGVQEIYVEAGAYEKPQYKGSLALNKGNYTIKALFADGRITYTATKVGAKTPLVSKVVAVPELKVHQLQMIELAAETSSAESSWIDDVQIKAIATSYDIKVKASPASGGKVSGGGKFTAGKKVTVTAKPKAGKVFVSWTENGKIVSKKASYTFTAKTSRTLTANFKTKASGEPPAALGEE